MSENSGLPRGDLRPLTRRLAELLASEEGTLALSQMQQLALLAGGRVEPVPVDTGLHIGIWAPTVRDDGATEFVRSANLAHDWRYWADVECIPAKQGARVVLLGESVARGYLFDPGVTPAGMLSGMLGVEVVDLARTDLSLDGLRALVESLPALEPDAVVLFAGNNWYNVVFELDELQRLASALRRDGYARCRRLFIEEIVPARCRSVLGALAETAAEFEFPVVVVVPEFNLRDWRGEPSVSAPVLPGDANVRWLQARRLAESALHGGDSGQAERLGLELLALDGETSSTGPSLLAAARPSEAREWLERARDAVVGILIAHSPRCPGSVQALLRGLSTDARFRVVDLPRIFERELDGRVPGREFFLDYCHLNTRGMRVAMSAVAEALEPLVGTGDARNHSAVSVDPEQEGIAHFLAAIHNAHYGQRDDVLGHHCSTAAALSQSAREHMRLYVDCAARWSEPWLCESFARLCDSAMVRRYLLAPELHGQKLADLPLIEAMVGALEKSGMSVRGSVERLLEDEHGAIDRVDLLDPRYRAFTFRDRAGYALAPERAYYRASDVQSRFALVRAQAGPVRLAITCRAPAEGEAGVRMNGQHAANLHIGTAWRTFTFEVAARRGVNWIVVEWPAAAPPAGELERAARRLERGVYPDVLPGFGEVHSFVASSAY